jgi:filamentous hemagglutinin family protein
MIANNNKTAKPSIVKNFLIFCLSMLITSTASSNPQDGTVTSGNATITQSPNSTVIQQNSPQAIIEWQSFNIGAKDSTHFQQPKNGIALNRINAQQGMTQIYGQLSATGRIILINPAGIYFGVGSVIHVGGLIASTSNISNANFLAGKYIFDQPSPFHAGIVNEGIIKAADYGLVALIGSTVTNRGMIEAELGSIVLATGDKFTLDFYGDQLINFSVDARASSNGRILNTGSLIADGGKILVTAEAAQGVLDNVIDMQGVAQARSVAQHDGQIILSATTGDIVVSGKLTTSAKKGAQGGNIQITANKIKVAPHAVIEANGDAGGGTIALNAHTAVLSGELSAMGNTNAVGGTIVVAANSIALLDNAVLNVAGGTAGGNISLMGKTDSTSDATPKATYIGTSYLSSMIADSMQSGTAGEINISADSVNIAGSVSAQGLGAKSVGGSVIVAANSFVTEGASLNVSGNAGGGNVTVAAESNPTKPAYINIDNRSVVLADADTTGTAGNIKLSADSVTVSGLISAQGISPASLGGTIAVAANSFTAAGATMTVSGGSGGGNITVAAESDVAAKPAYINIDNRSVVLADAITTGTAGNIKLSADSVSVSGLISAQGISPATLGGTIDVAANSFTAAGATMNVSSGSGGGSIAVNAISSNAQSYINIDANSVILANAFYSGTAGNISLAADQVTISGKINAQGISPTTIGGNITVAANSFIAEGAAMNVSAGSAGGTITVANAAYIGIDSLSLLVANAISDAGVAGKISLSGDDVTVAGNLSAQGNGIKSIGGIIDVYGQHIAVMPGAIITANADFVAGDLTIGGNPNSTSSNSASQYVMISLGSSVSAAVTGAAGLGGVIAIDAAHSYIGGSLDVSGLSYASAGGEITVAGNNVTVAPLAVINASGQQFGGEILLGGNLVTVASTASVDVDAGSKIIATANGNTTPEKGKAVGGEIQVYAANTTINGNLDVSAIAPNSGAQGGEVKILANHSVNIGSDAIISAAGDGDGGSVVIGGDQHGIGSDPSAQFTTIAQGSFINTASLTSGNGGNVVVWANNTTNFNGTIAATGGAVSGNGAAVEVSGKQNLNYAGKTNLTASHGTTGTLTLDPQNITIQTIGSNTPGSSNSVLTVATLENMLATANVLVITSTSGTAPGDITVVNNVAWNNSNQLTLSAYRDVNINATISNNAGGSLAVVADNTVDGVGTINFGNNGRVAMSGGGQVSMTYEPQNNNFRYPNTYGSYVNASNGSTVSYTPLNLVTPTDNNAIISSFAVIPNVMESLTLAYGQEPIEVIVPEGNGTILAFENNLEVINEKSPSPVSVRLMDQPVGSGCGESATCVSSDFVIE